MSRPHCLFLVLALVYPLLAAPAAYYGGGGADPDQMMGALGAYSPIGDLSDPKLREIAEFAIAEYNHRQSKHLVFQNLVRGQSQEVAGANYKLVIRVVNSVGSVPLNYEATVYEKLWRNVWKLNSFVQVDKDK